MRKHKIAGIWHKFSSISLITITIALVVCAGISIFALRANNLKMAELRQAVYAADEKNGDVETALNNLRIFIYGHMNTDLRSGNAGSQPPIQLVNRFIRAVAAEQARVAAQSNAAKVYSDAQAQCERSNLPLTARAQCIQNYVSTHGTSSQQPNLPPKEFYTFDFASPGWSPDLAGWSLVAALFFGIILLVRLAAGIVMKFYIKK
jgi:hypothetical protein